MSAASAPMYAQLLEKAGLLPAGQSVDPAATATKPVSKPTTTPESPTRPTSKWLGLPRILLDFETYVSKDYNLGASGMSYERYIMDGNFHAHCVGVLHPDGHCEVRSDVAAALSELQRSYGRNLDNVLTVMHNSAFDAAVLAWHHGIVPENIFDSMLAARLLIGTDTPIGLGALARRYSLPPKLDLDELSGVRHPDARQMDLLREYNARDLEITRALAEIFLPQLVGLPLELWTMEHTVKLFISKSLRIDTALVESELNLLEQRIGAALAESGCSAEQIRGRKSFSSLLSHELAATGRKVPMKAGKTAVPIPALSVKDPEMQALLNDEQVSVKRLAGLRFLLSSSAQVRSKLQFLLESARLRSGSYHPHLKYHLAVTGRFAGGNGFNVQNIGKPSKLDGFAASSAAALRRSLSAPPGMVLVSGDASQIEARVAAYLVGEDELSRQFAGGSDVYADFAGELFGEPARKSSGDSPAERRMGLLRNVGKEAVLGLGYGMGSARFLETLKSRSGLSQLVADGTISLRMCAKTVGMYRKKYPGFGRCWKKCEDAFASVCRSGFVSIDGKLCFFKRDGAVKVRLPSGRCLVYGNASAKACRKPVAWLDENGMERKAELDGWELSWGERGAKDIYGAKLFENIVQGVARDILCDVVRRLEEKGFPVILHTHDDVVCCVPEATAAECEAAIRNEWRSVPPWLPGLCLASETKTGRNLLEIS